MAHNAVERSEHDSSATVTLDPSVTAGSSCGKITAPVTGLGPPEAWSEPTTPAGSVMDATSGVGIDVCSPVGGDPVHVASWRCQDGMVKNGHTMAIPGTRPVVSKVANTPSVPGAGAPSTGGSGLSGG